MDFRNLKVIWETAGYLVQWPHFLRNLIFLRFGIVLTPERLKNIPYVMCIECCPSEPDFRKWKWIFWGLLIQILEIREMGGGSMNSMKIF